MARVQHSFRADLERYAKKVGRSLDATHKAIVIEFFSAVIMDTPVDEGTLRGNWNISTGIPNTSVNVNLKDKTGSKTKAKVRSHPSKAGTVTYLTNGLPYAMVAEMGLWGTGPYATIKTTRDGYSVQAPYGMVRRNMARIQSNITASVQRARA